MFNNLLYFHLQDPFGLFPSGTRQANEKKKQRNPSPSKPSIVGLPSIPLLAGGEEPKGAVEVADGTRHLADRPGPTFCSLQAVFLGPVDG
ncbi:hypothetical protein GWI33_017928 [Rhynchophorus ferrugineus]|uniref:Uncharacterized protein n=1 Tax=Rhynchophorus ferrugineus TaxID=354439 RepID=A0A834I159_RHYFE|nr:hypothetical protein GWI33_017928 [Rhynchophorus ferrugineus]